MIHIQILFYREHLDSPCMHAHIYIYISLQLPSIIIYLLLYRLQNKIQQNVRLVMFHAKSVTIMKVSQVMMYIILYVASMQIMIDYNHTILHTRNMQCSNMYIYKKINTDVASYIGCVYFFLISMYRH